MYEKNPRLDEDNAKKFSVDENGMIVIPNYIRIIGAYAFNCRKDIRRVILPEGIVSIEDDAFNACHNLEEINIPSTVHAIGSDAFARCFKLKSLRLPEGITTVSAGLCQHCSSLEYLYIPDSVTHISRIAFWYCYHLRRIELSHSVVEIEDEAFDGCSNIGIVAPEGSFAWEYAKKNGILLGGDIEPSSTTVDNSAFMVHNKKPYAFISYSTKNQTSANSMREVLKKRGLNVWMAPGDIPAGSKYAQVINKAIKGCACVVLMLTDASQNSIWVSKEVERAVHYHKPIIPVQLEDVILNDEFEFYISTDHIVALQRFDENSEELNKIITVVSGILGCDKIP